nr:SDR family NAD(P)-dependent oxidoreductase [Fictibacillus solisalsi]
MMGLKGKAAIVTGGSSGIGEATVREMVNSGAHVLIATSMMNAVNSWHPDFPASRGQTEKKRKK